MKILLINKYLYPKGGDAISTLSTGDLLSRKGHEVSYWGMEHPSNPYYPLSEYFVSHVDYSSRRSFAEKVHSSLNILYSREARIKIEEVVKNKKPEIVHLNNFAHQISPSILDVLRKYHIPSVMTMRDYKLVCPTYSMLLGGKPCEKCKAGRYFFCFLKKCTKGSFLKSFVNMLEMYLHHRILHIYDKIDMFISPSIFLKEKVKEMGFKGDVVYLPNFTTFSELEPSYGWENESVIYVGRLSHEKGLKTLISAVRGLSVRLRIIGDGPLRAELDAKVQNEGVDNVELLGYKEGSSLHREVKRAMFAVIPSECYENNPRSVIESFALGKPVIGARIGGIPELVRDYETGFLFKSGSIADLRDKIELMLREKKDLAKMGMRAREFVEKELNAEKHYVKLMEIYQSALDKGLRLKPVVKRALRYAHRKV